MNTTPMVGPTPPMQTKTIDKGEHNLFDIPETFQGDADSLLSLSKMLEYSCFDGDEAVMDLIKAKRRERSIARDVSFGINWTHDVGMELSSAVVY